MDIFYERELTDYLAQRRGAMVAEVHAQSQAYLLSVSEEQYATYLIEKYALDPLVLHWDDMFLSHSERMVDAERFPVGFNVTEGKAYRKPLITYHLPYSGDERLHGCTPSCRLMWSTDVRLEGGCVCLDMVDWRGDPEAIKQEAGQVFRDIRRQWLHLASEVDQFNTALDGDARALLKERKRELLRQANLAASLGVPVRKSTDVPSTFAVPTVTKKALVRPSAPTGDFKPEPALADATYNEILRAIHEFGVAMEQHPSVFAGKNEEALRDHLLMVLAPNFESVTGETFNRSGKTDILIRHEGKNVFVAECTFWDGKKAFLTKIDQALGYLTWRDSKAAILCFVKSKEVQKVVEQIEPTISEHNCFIATRPKSDESWFNFDMHLRGDPDRNVKLAVLCFHFPRT